MASLNAQQEKAVNLNDDKILCLAGAGTGKTFCMISRISRIVDEGVDPSNILVLTFTHAAAFEMKERYQKTHVNERVPEFRTFHSFCYSLIASDTNVRKKLGYFKIPTIADQGAMKRLKTSARMQSGFKLSERHLKKQLALTPAQQSQVEIYNKTLYRLLRQENIITFDMLCYRVCKLFVENDECIQKYKQKYQYIFVDEFQDTDYRQYDFIKSFQNSKLFVVGDALQCQPAGTLVTMSDMSIKPIEDLKVGDYVLTYAPKEGRYIRNLNKQSGNINRYTKRIKSISKHFADNIVRVSSKNHSSCYTKDHVTYAKIHYDGNEQSYVTYLMSNDKGWFRVGSTKLFLDSQKTAFGPRLRMQNEHGNRVWVLGVYQSATDAWLNEQFVAYKFGIPQVTWNHENVKFSILDLETLYAKLGDLSDNAESCLNHYNRDIKYPMFTSSDLHIHFSKLHMFECRVGNLIPGIFDIVYPVYKTNSEGYQELHNSYEVIEEITDESDQIVYGLDVEDNHNYVGDGILTHNCIYSFRGADSSIIKKLSNDDEWTTVKLFQNYRSTKQICNHANNMSTYAQDSYRIAIDTDVEGQPVNVVSVKGYKHFNDTVVDPNTISRIVNSIKTTSGTSAILCRTNKEVECVIDYLCDHSIPYFTGKKNTDSIHVLKSVVDNEYLVDWLSTYLNADSYANYIRMVAISEDETRLDLFLKSFSTLPFIKAKLDKVFAIRSIFKRDGLRIQKCQDILSELGITDVTITTNATTVSEVIKYLIDVIDNDISSDIYVGTIHSSKGLEYDNVYLVGVNGSYFKLTNEENMNLYYVGITRAKSNLHVFYTNDSDDEFCNYRNDNEFHTGPEDD